jgi:hypothetical protein
MKIIDCKNNIRDISNGWVLVNRGKITRRQAGEKSN